MSPWRNHTEGLSTFQGIMVIPSGHFPSSRGKPLDVVFEIYLCRIMRSQYYSTLNILLSTSYLFTVLKVHIVKRFPSLISSFATYLQNLIKTCLFSKNQNLQHYVLKAHFYTTCLMLKNKIQNDVIRLFGTMSIKDFDHWLETKHQRIKGGGLNSAVVRKTTLFLLIIITIFP